MVHWLADEDVGVPGGLEGGDGGHDAFGEEVVALFAGGGFADFFGGEMDGGADGDADAGEADAAGAAGEGFACAADADGLDGCAGFGGDEADAWSGFAEVAIEGASAFWEDEDAVAFLEFADDGFEAGHVRAILIDGDGVPAWVEPCTEAAEEGFAGEVAHLGFVEVADEWGVEVAFVIGCDEDGAFFDEVFRAIDPHAEE